MARFHFKLARLLRVREIREEIARTELLAAESAVRAAEKTLEEARDTLREAERELAVIQTRAAIAPAEVLVAQRTVPLLTRRIQERKQLVSVLAKAADAARGAWQATRVDVRVLEKLEDRARGAYREEERAREDKTIQETVDRKAALAMRGATPEERAR